MMLKPRVAGRGRKGKPRKSEKLTHVYAEEKRFLGLLPQAMEYTNSSHAAHSEEMRRQFLEASQFPLVLFCD